MGLTLVYLIETYLIEEFHFGMLCFVIVLVINTWVYFQSQTYRKQKVDELKCVAGFRCLLFTLQMLLDWLVERYKLKHKCSVSKIKTLMHETHNPTGLVWLTSRLHRSFICVTHRVFFPNTESFLFKLRDRSQNCIVYCFFYYLRSA